jgi:hypothetical protein
MKSRAVFLLSIHHSRHFYKRMGIKVTPQMTLAPEPKKRASKKRKAA